MNLGQMFAIFRAQTRDLVEPYLFGDDTVLASYANEGAREACRRGRLIVDSTTVNDGATSPLPVCQYAVTAGDSVLTLHPSILFVKRVKLASLDRRTPRINARDLDRFRPGWESESGDVLAYSPDHQTGQLRWYQKPIADDTANLTVVRLPLSDMVKLSDAPEINARFHDRLVDWMIYRAYEEDDSETIDPQRAAKALARFEQEFGHKSSAIDETYIQNEYDFGGLDGVF